MAEVGNLLGLITDEETRSRLIAQMEQMFDSAEDEEKLIEQIGSPTKVAVALIRYADKKRAGNAPAEPAAAEEPAAPVTEMMEQAEANAVAPEQEPMPELAFEEAEPVVEEPELEVAEILLPAEEPEVVEEIVEEVAETEPEAFVEPEPYEEEFVPVEETETFVEEVEAPVEAEEEFVEAEPEEFPVAPAALDEELARAVEAGAAEAFSDVPVDELPTEEAAAAEEAAFLAEEAAVIGDAAVSEEEAAADALAEELFGGEEEAPEVEYRTVKNGGKAFLYFLIPGLVPGLPVFFVLFALSLAFLAIGVAAVAAAVGVFMSAFVGFNVVADMLLLIGAGTSLFAIALVLMWFAIWFLTRVCFGWVRLIHRGGVRFSRKEVPVE